MKTRRSYPEEFLHKQVAGLFAAAMPKSVFCTTFPAGGGGAQRGARLRAMGLKAGVPDWLLVYQSRAFFIELKAKKGVISEDQSKTHLAIEHAGGIVGVCYSLEDVAAFCVKHELPLNTKVQNGKVYAPNGFKIATGAQRYNFSKPKISRRALRTAAEMFKP